MKIYLAQSAGFCDGVKRAYDIVNEIDMETAKKPVCILGSLVHNPDVAKKVEEKGIEKIDREKLETAPKGEIGTLIMTAHGVGPDVFEIAKEKGIEVIDTTCPRVIKVQRLAQVFAKRGYEVILVGDKEHKEVDGIHAWGDRKTQIVSSEKDLSNLRFSPEKKVAVLSQTTQNEEFFDQVSTFVKEKNPEAEIISTICHATHDRQEEVKKLSREFEAIIVIGSPTSANSTRLYEISKELNPKTFFVENAKEINLTDFSSVESIAVMAGASTPDWIIQEVMELFAPSFEVQPLAAT